jgi:hypothetical protein
MSAMQAAVVLPFCTRHAPDKAAFTATRDAILIRKAAQERLFPCVEDFPRLFLVRNRDIVFKRHKAWENPRASLEGRIRKRRVIGCDLLR